MNQFAIAISLAELPAPSRSSGAQARTLAPRDAAGRFPQAGHEAGRIAVFGWGLGLRSAKVEMR
jgi:hypothetical protein